MIAQLDAIYAQLPKMTCKGLCGPYVCGPIPMSAVEFQRLVTATMTTPGHDPVTKHCRYLRETGCAVYPLRPMVCRVYGLQRQFRCAHGCEPERWLSDAEAARLTAMVNQLSENVYHAPVTLVR